MEETRKNEIITYLEKKIQAYMEGPEFPNRDNIVANLTAVNDAVKSGKETFEYVSMPGKSGFLHEKFFADLAEIGLDIDECGYGECSIIDSRSIEEDIDSFLNS